MGYDIIGDIHGQADKLESLLGRMGYRRSAGTWRHASRKAIFVGDFIDRGPKQLETVNLVRRMVDDGHALAVMGNHEFNAIAWFLPDAERPGQHLRVRDGRNRQQHAAFLAAVEHRPAEHREGLDRVRSPPLPPDLPRLRAAHACWHAGYMAELEPRLAPGRRLTEDLVQAASREGWMEFRTVEGLTKGLEAPLPAGHSFRDKDGHPRRRVRLRWWDPAATTLRQAAMMDRDALAQLPETEVPGGHRAAYDDAKPVFFGHYWLSGTPAPQSATVACVDYSAGAEGALVAYRRDGEPTLEAARFVASH